MAVLETGKDEVSLVVIREGYEVDFEGPVLSLVKSENRWVLLVVKDASVIALFEKK